MIEPHAMSSSARLLSFRISVIGFSLFALSFQAAELRIADGGQHRRFERVVADRSVSDAPTNAPPNILLLESGVTPTQFNQRRLTRDILVELNATAEPALVVKSVSAESFKVAPAGRNFYIFRAKETALVFSTVNKLRALPEVWSAEPLLARRRAKKFFPSDPLFPTEWHLNNSGINGARAGI